MILLEGESLGLRFEDWTVAGNWALQKSQIWKDLDAQSVRAHGEKSMAPAAHNQANLLPKG